MRTLVLVAAALLVVALVASLAVSKWKNPFNRRDLPQRLGLDIQQEANGWTYTHAQSGHTLYKIHASKLVQLTQDKGGRVLLHDVKIELYGEDGSRVDRIEGAEFEYDPKGGTAKANGQVEIILMRPGVAPAIAPKATPGKALGDKPKSPALAVADTASKGEIHVKTSGLVFDQKSGVAATAEHVEFVLAQGEGSSTGASYDSQQGLLVLDRSVRLNTRRGAETVELQAQHAEFERGDQVCHLRAATADYRDGQATAGEAKIQFRADGSVVRLDVIGGFTLTTATGGHLTAPAGLLEFDEHNQPRHGHLQGGIILDSVGEGRQMHASATAADLEFTPKGVLHRAHLERDVTMHSEEQSESAAGPLRVRRNWRSPVADVGFREARHGQVEVEAIHGIGGVVVTGENQRGEAAVSPSRLAADELTGQFGPGSALSLVIGVGHAAMEQTTATGTKQSTSGDRLEVHFVPASATGSKSAAKGEAGGAAQIQTATVDGHVVLVQEQPAKPGAPPATMRATAGRAVYEGAGEWLHLTQSPRVEDGGLQLTADKVDVSQASGDAFAHGNVKASWTQQANGKGLAKSGQSGVALGGDGPAHVISAEAQLHQATGEATFRGQARLWQQANSVAAPVIVLDRNRQTLVARAAGAAEPVRVVLLSAAGQQRNGEGQGKPGTPSVLRMRGGDLKYSDAARTAVMHGGVAGSVVAETGTATSSSNEVELVLLPQGNHAGKDAGQAQVDRMTARGHVAITSQGRRGTGEQLVYRAETGEYVLTGTAATPPRMTDPARGTVTGEALIFHGHDDSVSIEGGGRKTTTETSAPK
jgi:lipopolysaccharide export system protein LptA